MYYVFFNSLKRANESGSNIETDGSLWEGEGDLAGDHQAQDDVLELGKVQPAHGKICGYSAPCCSCGGGSISWGGCDCWCALFLLEQQKGREILEFHHQVHPQPDPHVRVLPQGQHLQPQ
jgi:hypothetical protein